MTDNRKDDVMVRKTRITAAEELRDQFKDEIIENYQAVYGDDYLLNGKRGETRSAFDKKDKKYSYDKLLSFLKTELPGLVLTRPDVYLSIKKEAEKANPQAQELTKLVESRLDTILGDMDGWATQVRVMLADAHCAYGISKVVLLTEIEPHPLAGTPKTDEAGKPLMDMAGALILHPAERIARSQYEILRVDPLKYLIDEKCKNDGTKAAFRGEEIGMTLEELKASRIYKKEIIDALEAKVKTGVNRDLKDHEINLKLYEIYDRFNDRIEVICDQYEDDFLREDSTPEGIEGDPYDELKFTEIPGQWMPKFEMTPGRQYQEDYRQSREWVKSWARKCTPQWGLNKAWAEANEAEAKKVGDGVSDAVKINSETNVVLLNKDALTANASLKEHMETVTRDFDEIMGQTAQARGLTGEADFATEVEVAQVKGDQRAVDKLNLVKRFLAAQVEKVLKLMAVNPAESPEIREALAIISPDLDIEIDIEQKSPKNRAIDRKQMMEAMANAPILAQSPTYLKQLIKTFDSIREQDAIFQEIMQVQQATAKAAKPAPAQEKIPISIAFKGEMLPIEAQDMILDKIFKMDLPINAPSAPTQPVGTPLPPTGAPLPIGEGTEGMEPGAGMMPSGETL